MSNFTRIVAAAGIAVSTFVPTLAVQAMPRLAEKPAVAKASEVTDVRWRRVCNRHRCRNVWQGPRGYRPRVVIKPKVVIKPRAGVRRGYTRHDRWCLARYRSYNPATKRFLGYDGRYHRCKSPYHG